MTTLLFDTWHFCLSHEHISVRKWPHFHLPADDHIYFCEKITTLLAISRLPHYFLCERWYQTVFFFCLAKDQIYFVFVQLTPLLSLSWWPYCICQQMATLYLCADDPTVHVCRWPHFIIVLMTPLYMCADDHTFIFVPMTTLYIWADGHPLSLSQWPHCTHVHKTTLLYVWQGIGTNDDC